MREQPTDRDAADLQAHLNMPALAVNNLYATIQGEGALAGTPMILVRLHNCPVGCPFCDTKHTWGEFAPGGAALNDANFVGELYGREWRGENPKWTAARAGDLVSLIREENRLLGGKIKWVMLTGGEPALQDLRPLVNALHACRLAVNLETSGTAAGHAGAGIDWVTCSPKINMPGGRKLDPEALALADEIKFVIGKEADIEKMDTFYAEFGEFLKPTVRRSLQPMSASSKATALCVQTAIRRGWAVSIQTHKLMGVE